MSLRRRGATPGLAKRKLQGERRHRRTLPVPACLVSPRRTPGNLGRPSQALSAVGVKARAESLVPEPGPSKASAAQLPSLGAEASRRRGERRDQPRGLTSWSSLALIAPVAGHPPGGRLRRRESESRGPQPAASPFRALGCGRHTPRTADDSHARPPAFGQREAARWGLWAGSPRPPRVGRRGDWGDAAGRQRQRLRLLLFLASPIGSLSPHPLFPTPVGNGASSYVLWSSVKFRDSGWCRALSLRCRKCFLCLRRRGPGSLACGDRLWGGGGRHRPRRSVTPCGLPFVLPRLAATCHSCSGPGACGLGESGPGDPRGQARPPRERASSEQC